MSLDNNNLSSIKKQLITAVNSYCSDAAQKWLQQAVHAIADSEQLNEDLGLYSAMAKRKLGAVLMQDADDLDSISPALNIQHWTTADCGRIILLITAIEQSSDQTENIIRYYFKIADEAEQVALLRSFSLFAPAKYLTELALDAGRTNSLELLSALTLDNPYPARYYSELEFNQMVLKGLFLGLAIKRINSLGQRANPELSRMGENYVIERENAGRSIPVDIWLAIAPCASDTGKQQLIHYLKHKEMGHRYYCCLALSQYMINDPSVQNLLKEHLKNEQEPLIIELLKQVV